MPLRKGSAAVQKPPQAISVEAGGSILSQRPKGYNRSPGTSQPNARFLSALLEVQDKYAEAETLFRRAIEIDEKALGKDHPTVATDYNNLARLLQDQGKYAEAEPLYRRPIEIFQATLGTDHSNTVMVKRNSEVCDN